MLKLKLLIVAGALAATTSAFAQPAGGGGGAGQSPEMQAARTAMREACAADLKGLCDGKQGRDAMMCLRDNADKVGGGCKDAMAKMRAARSQAAPQS
ncbi:MAG: hypothetical protein E7812_07380 [Phenylobacterium sp.]|nr:MAG: hypothetical protein E7812_07380 [Phenylobacterium sp.]